MKDPIVKLLSHTVDTNTTSATSLKVSYDVSETRAPSLWEKGHFGQGIHVAVLDTGITRSHPEFQGAIVRGKNFTTDYNSDHENFEDNNGHGTHAAGSIAARNINSPAVGMAPKAMLHIYKVLDKDGNGFASYIQSAIYDAVRWVGPKGERIRIINMSLGSEVYHSGIHHAIRYAMERGVHVVCAAGNSGDGTADTDEYVFPASLEEVISVGAYDGFGGVAHFSSSYEGVDFIAPGSGVLSTYLNNQYVYMSGTSMSSPKVAGALALLIPLLDEVFGRELGEAEIYAQLVRRSVPLWNISQKLQGNGRIVLDNKFANIDFNNLSYEDAIKELGIRKIFDTPQFWLDQWEKHRGDPNSDYRYMALAFRKLVAYIKTFI